MAAALTPLNALKVSQHHIPAFQRIPNTSIQNKPLMIYHSAFPHAGASQIESHLSKVGVVSPQWRYTMYSDTHFHSTSHEVLAIASGSARCCFGGESNPNRVEPTLQKGDVVIVPAGVGHRLLEDYGGFQVIPQQIELSEKLALAANPGPCLGQLTGELPCPKVSYTFPTEDY